MIYVGENKTVICKGEFHPAALYKGNKKIAGYTLTEFSGQGNIILKNCYNDKIYCAEIPDINSITVRGKNILDMSKHTVTQGYYLDSEGDANNVHKRFIKISPIAVEESTAYTISIGSKHHLYTIWFFQGSTAITRINTYNLKSKTFTTPENCSYIRVSIDSYYTTQSASVDDLEWVMLEKGTGDGNYEPYVKSQTILFENGIPATNIPTFKGTTVIEVDSDSKNAICGKYKKWEV